MSPILPTLALLGGLWWFMSTSRSYKPWTEAEVIAAVLGEVSAAGLPLELGQALVTNARAESALDPYAVGDGGRSVGLYQIDAAGSLVPKLIQAFPLVRPAPAPPAGVRGLGWATNGAPDPADPRACPRQATRAMIAACRQSPAVMGAIASSSPPSRLAYLVCTEVERPASAILRATERAASAYAEWGA